MTPKYSRYISWLDEFETSRLVVLYLRDSDDTQDANLRYQKASLKAKVERKGFHVIDAFAEIAPGWRRRRSKLRRAILKAKRHGAVVVAESLDRFWRRRKRRDGTIPPLRKGEIKLLLLEADGVELATFEHPDSPPGKVRAEQTKRGQQGRGRVGGRPKIKHPFAERKKKLLPEVLKLHRDGYSYSQIAKLLNCARSTAGRWGRNIKMRRFANVT